MISLISAGGRCRFLYIWWHIQIVMISSVWRHQVCYVKSLWNGLITIIIPVKVLDTVSWPVLFFVFYQADYGNDRSKYLRVQPATALSILDKLKEAEKKNLVTFLSTFFKTFLSSFFYQLFLLLLPSLLITDGIMCSTWVMELCLLFRCVCYLNVC